MAAEWTYHTRLKATATVTFEQGRLALGATNTDARDLLRDTSRVRAKLLDQLTNLSQPSGDIMTGVQDYMGLVRGIAEGLTAPRGAAPPPGPPPAAAAPESTTSTSLAPDAAATSSYGTPQPHPNGDRMRSAVSFRWSDIVSGEVLGRLDARFDMACTLLNAAEWHSKRAALLAKTSAGDEEAAKEIFRCLKVAAGLYQFLTDNLGKQLGYMPNTDMDERLIKGKFEQCMAEAQEVTVERAREKGHKPELIAGLARNEHDRFLRAAEAVKTMDPKLGLKFYRYLMFKAKFYEAYSFCHVGLKLFAEEKCGESLKAYAQAQEAMEEAKKLSHDYVAANVSKFSYHTNFSCDPSEHLVFRTLERVIAKAHDKSKSENGFIYHHKVPAEPVELPAGKSLIEADPYTLPELNAQWYKAQFAPDKIPLKGEDTAADTASAASDEGKVSLYHNEKSSSSSGGLCTIS